MSEYIPFGEEWEKEMKKHKKDELVEFLKHSLKKNIKLDRSCATFLILKKFNPLNNALDAYLYAVCEYGLGEIDKEPEPKDYGIAQTTNPTP